MPGTITLNSILDFIIPIAVWAFIIWIIYRIPIVQQGIDRLREWNERRKERAEGNVEDNSIKTIRYE